SSTDFISASAPWSSKAGKDTRSVQKIEFATTPIGLPHVTPLCVKVAPAFLCLYFRGPFCDFRHFHHAATQIKPPVVSQRSLAGCQRHRRPDQPGPAGVSLPRSGSQEDLPEPGAGAGSGLTAAGTRTAHRP